MQLANLYRVAVFALGFIIQFTATCDCSGPGVPVGANRQVGGGWTDHRAVMESRGYPTAYRRKDTAIVAPSVALSR